MLLSIVTIHLDDPGGLARTLKSLQRVSSSEEVEWIFIDGGSNREIPGMAEALNLAFERSDRHVSERDEGIYDAMNKGTAMATGQFVLYLNAGDELHPDFEPGQVSRFAGADGCSMLLGRCVECYEDGNEVEPRTRPLSWTWYGMPACHPAILFNRQQLGEHPYDTRFSIAADYDLFCRLSRDRARVRRIPVRISRFYLGGVSDVAHDLTLREEHQIRTRYFPVPAWLSSVIMLLRKFLKRLASYAGFRKLWRRWV